jgi:hypothetical protein
MMATAQNVSHNRIFSENIKKDYTFTMVFECIWCWVKFQSQKTHTAADVL